MKKTNTGDMNKWHKSLYPVLAVLLLGSCSQDEPWHISDGTGSIKLNLSSSADVSSAIPSVRSVSTQITPPPTSDFSIRLSKTDGSFTKTWASLEEFSKEESFMTGIYEIEAFYGSEDSQGVLTSEHLGYEFAHYSGLVTDIEVREGETTSVQLHASLANAVVTVEYSEAFKKYFSEWSTILQTHGKSSLELEQNSEGGCYVVPGEVDVIIYAKQQNNREVMLNPAVFTAEPRHLYKIRYDIYNGEVGQADQLVITFNDDPIKEHDVIIDLSDELMNAEIPEITPAGFNAGQTIEAMYGTNYGSELRFNIIAHGGISQALLTIDSKTYTPEYLENGVVDLCSADSRTQALINGDGIKVHGLYSSGGTLAQLDVAGLCKFMPEGEHIIELKVKDKYGQVSLPVKLIVSSLSASMQVYPKEDALFGNEYADLILTYNGPDPTLAGNNPFTFKVEGDNGFIDSKLISINDNPYTRSFESHDYTYRIYLPLADKDEIPVDVYFNGGSKAAMSTVVKIRYPEYSLQYDALARKLRLRIDPSTLTADKRELFTRKMRVFIDGNEKTVNKDYDNLILTVNDNLNPGQEYSVETTLQSASEPSSFGSSQTIMMEAATQLPDLMTPDPARQVSIDPINVGGPYEIKFVVASHQQITSSILRDVPKGWANLNDLTCYPGASNKNTWYLEPSTYIDNGVVVIRSVAYHHNGPDIPESTSRTTYYCTNTPDINELSKSVGELFLGSYSYNGSASRSDGVSFGSRPTGISFRYNYDGLGSETGYVYIRVKDAQGKVLAQAAKSLSVTTDMKDETLELPAYAFGTKAATIEVSFKSVNSDIPLVKMPSSLDEGRTAGNYLFDRKKDPNDYVTFASGSVLKISDIKLIY